MADHKRNAKPLRRCRICGQGVKWKEYDQHVLDHWCSGDIKIRTENPYKGKSPQEAKEILEALVSEVEKYRKHRRSDSCSTSARKRWGKFIQRKKDMYDPTQPPGVVPAGYLVDEEGDPCYEADMGVEE